MFVQAKSKQAMKQVLGIRDEKTRMCCGRRPARGSVGTRAWP